MAGGGTGIEAEHRFHHRGHILGQRQRAGATAETVAVDMVVVSQLGVERRLDLAGGSRQADQPFLRLDRHRFQPGLLGEIEDQLHIVGILLAAMLVQNGTALVGLIEAAQRRRVFLAFEIKAGGHHLVIAEIRRVGGLGWRRTMAALYFDDGTAGHDVAPAAGRYSSRPWIEIGLRCSKSRWIIVRH